MANTPAKKTTAAKVAPAQAGPVEPVTDPVPLPAAGASPDEIEDAERARVEAEQKARDAAARGRAEVKRDADTPEERKAADGLCVVSDGTQHAGRALPGKKICSAHEMHYLPDGTPRAKVHAAELKAAREPDGGHLVDEGA